MHIKLVFFLFLISIQIANAQNAHPQHFYTQLQTQYGKPIIYSDSLGSTLEKSFEAFNFRFGLQTDGERLQDQLLGFPRYGVGIFHANLHNKDTLGNPWATFFYFTAPLIRKGKFELDYEAAFGIGWNFAKFDPITNSKNDLIGSDLNAFGSLELSAAYRIHPRWMLDAGIDFLHFSNGTIQTPNKGMNLWATHLGLSYFFQNNSSQKFEPEQFQKRNIDKITRYWELDFSAIVGGKTTNKTYGVGPNYLTSVLLLDLYRRYHWLGRYGAGINLIYDESLSEHYLGNPNTAKLLFVGVHLAHEYAIYRFSFQSQFGTYLYKGTPAKGIFYFRVGLKYDITHRFFGSFTLKTANGFKADFFEFGLGYRMKFFR
jgi:hypothetical protein